MNLPFPFILGIAMAAGVWMLVFALRFQTLHACLGLLIVLACFGPEFAKWELGPISASPDRLAFIFLVLLSVLKRVLTWQPKLTLDRCDFLLVSLLGLLLISIATHPNPPHTNPRTPAPGYLFLTSYLFPTLFYWIARLRPVHNADVRDISGFFVIFGIYLAMTAVCESHGGSAFIFPKYILQTRLHYEGRSVGPFLSAPALGTWLTVATASLVLLWLRVRGLFRAVLTSLFPLFAYAQYLTETRSAWMGYVVAVPLAALLSVRSSVRHVLAVGLTLVGLTGGLFVGERFIFPERKEGRGVVEHSTNQRLSLLQRSLAMFVQRPILGWGFGQFESAARIHGGGGPLQIVESDDVEELASHNIFLRSLAELGLVGFTLQILVLSGWIATVRNTLKWTTQDDPKRPLAILFAATLCAYMAEAMFHDVTFIPQDNMLIFFLAGSMGVSAKNLQEPMNKSQTNPAQARLSQRRSSHLRPIPAMEWT